MTSGWSPRARAFASIFVVVLQVCAQPIGMARSAQSNPAPDDKALAGFRAAAKGYVALRTRIRGEVPPLRVTPNAQEIADRSDALACAVTRARRNAPQGQF